MNKHLHSRRRKNYFCLFSLGFLLLSIGLPSFAQSLARHIPGHNQVQQQSISLREALSELEAKHQVTIGYKDKLIDRLQVSHSAWKQEPGFEEAIRLLLTPLDLVHKRIGEKAYVIKPKSTQSKKSGQDSASYPLGENNISSTNSRSSSAITAENNEPESAIRGKVTSAEDGQGLPGVNVLLKGSSVGTTTDAGGNYSLTVPDKGGILVFSYIGYTTEEVPVSNQATIDVALVPDIQSLGEVVVVGYGTQERKDVTSAITTVKGKDIQNIPVTSVDAVLQGRAAGVQVVQNSGAPGNEVYVRIRGNGSLFGENRPLYVIDGVPMNNIAAGQQPLEAGGQRITTQNDINPNDIASIEILKDAAAAAIYGSRAGNGVILITTKRGAKGAKAKVDFNAYTGIAQITRRLDLLNGQQYVDLYQESINNRNLYRPANAPFVIDTTIRNTGINTDWQKEIFQAAPVSNYGLSVSGGSDKLQHYLSLNYFDQDGTVKGQEFKRYNGRVNLDFNVNDKLKVGTNLTLSRSYNKRIPNDFSGESVMGLALVQNPNNPVYNADGSYYIDRRGALNPIVVIDQYRQQSVQDRYVGNIYGEYIILKGLTFRSSLGMDHLNEKGDYYIPRIITNGNSSARVNMYEVYLWVNENTLSYARNFGEKHSFNALLGQSVQEASTRRIGAGADNSSTDIIQTVSSNTNRFEAQDYRSTWGLVSYFGRAGYTFADKYLLTGVMRIDGSSRFGKNYRYGYFPSVSAGWRISEEPFMRSLSFVNDLKLRASIGITGNNEGLGNDFPSLATYATGSNYGTLPGIRSESLSYNDLSWESTVQTNLGIDISLFKGRVSFTAEAYQKNTNDLIFKLELPYSSGFARTFGANVGKLENKGLEFALNTRNLEGQFTWATGFNISMNRNEITYLPLTVANDPRSADFVEGLPNAFNSLGPQSIFRVGAPVGSFFGYRHLGVNPETGDYIFEDLNGDGVITTDDRQILGNALPKHTGGLTNSFAYKGFELDLFLQWSYGNRVYNQTRAVLERMGSFNNSSTRTLNRWTPDNPNTDLPKAIWQDPAPIGSQPNGIYSQRFIEDGSFLRVKTVTLAYNFPADLVNKIKLTSLRIYVAAQNLATFTNYTGYDPETQNQQFKNSQLGVDYITQPQPRTLMTGINIGF
jgi:TonB-linked SusC/RagA family outer membrane protein